MRSFLPRFLQRSSIAICVLAGIATIGTVFSIGQPVGALANASDFQPGRIIDDEIFYNSDSLSTSNIQTFLNSKVPNCDTNGTQPASDWGRPDLTHAQLASYIRNGTNGYSKDTGFHAPPYTCLKDYKQNTPQMEAASGYCSALSAKTNRTAAQIIKDVASACGINPQVLIVLLQKEQSLVTDVWPLNRQYASATGFDCPDSAPCDPAYSGFFYQVYYAARQFKVYKAHPNSYNYMAGRTNRIYWQTNLGNWVNTSGNYNSNYSTCGYSNVYIENQATAALYIYTPYQPNQRAMANLYGTGDSCSAYGNRNFWRMFTDWFGSTRLSYQPLDDPRWMQLKVNTYKIDWPLGTTIDPELLAGRQIYFPDKIHVGGQWLLRTAWDKSNNNLSGIPLSDLEEVPINPITPVWMSVSADTRKVDPLRNKTYEAVGAMTAVKVVDMMVVDGKTYYRTAWERDKDRPRFLPAEDLEAFTFYDMLEARTLYIPKTIEKLDVQTGGVAGVVPGGSYLTFEKRITLDNTLYVQASIDDGTNYVISFDKTSEFTGKIEYVSLTNPRWMKLAVNTYKKTIPAIENTGPELLAGRQIYFPDKVNIDGVWYLRTEYDRGKGNAYGIRLDELTEL